MEKKIAVVLVTYNGSFWIKKNILSIQNSSFPVAIIAVDNASTDDSVAILESFSDVEIIKSQLNLGFGKANTIGMKRALENGADYVFLLNQDTWIFENTIQNLVERMMQNPIFGILSPMHYSANAVDLDANFATYLSRKTNDIISQNISEVPFVNAAAWMISKECISKVGYFEPLFGHYGEDRNFANRVIYYNFKIGILEDAIICHDRIISRHVMKDVLQSEFKVLNALLDVNYSFVSAFINALKEVFGLPKYFYKHYGFGIATHLFFKLSIYFVQKCFNLQSILSARKQSKLGLNGI